MLKKAILSKEEAAALESALEINDGDKASVVFWHANDLWDGKREVLNDQDLDLIIRALYVGYEIEPGPEEKVLEHYNTLDSAFYNEKLAIKNTLDLLNIQIKGINC